MKLTDRIDRWIFDEYAPCAKGLPLYRIFFALYLLVFYLPRFTPLAGMPASFFHPGTSVATLLPGLPPGWCYVALDFLLEFAAMALLFGYRTRAATFALLAGIVLGNTYRYAVGPKIDHDILIPATLFCMGFSGWGRRLSWDTARLPRGERRCTAAWPVSLLFLIVGYAMFTAALPKAMSGWASPHLDATRGQLIFNSIEMERPSAATDFLLGIHSHVFWKMADYSTLAIEGGFILCLFSLPAMRTVASFAALFHTLVFYSMSIFFSYNLAAYTCLLDLRRFLTRAPIRHAVSRFGALARRMGFVPLALAAVILCAIQLALQRAEIDLTAIPDNLAIPCALVIAIVSLLHLLGDFTDRFVFRHAFPLDGRHTFIVLYDGECGLCDKWVQFILKHDPRGLIRFAALQSPRGRQLLGEAGGAPDSLSSMVLLIDGCAYQRSTGPLLLLRQIGGAWSLLGSFGLVPVPVRDFVYNTIAANRHRWFGRSNESCRLLQATERDRFLT